MATRERDVPLGGKEGTLENAGREDDLVVGRTLVRVLTSPNRHQYQPTHDNTISRLFQRTHDLIRAHLPAVPVSQVAQPGLPVPHGVELVGRNGVAEEIVLLDVESRVVGPKGSGIGRVGVERVPADQERRVWSCQ